MLHRCSAVFAVANALTCDVYVVSEAAQQHLEPTATCLLATVAAAAAGLAAHAAFDTQQAVNIPRIHW